MKTVWFLEFQFVGFLVIVATSSVNAAISGSSMRIISELNSEGPYLGIVVPNAFEMNPILQSPSFAAHPLRPFFDFSGKRFRIGRLENEKVILVMTGLAMMNAGLTTELLLTLFEIKGILHFGTSGNAYPNLQIGDVVIPRYWAHTGLWNWQRYGEGPDDELGLEANGDYTRNIGYIKFSDFNVGAENEKSSDNLLNNVWFQPEELFPANWIPEMRQHAFWVPVNEDYFAAAEKLEDMKLKRCINSTCLPRAPIVIRVERGSSANIFVSNAAYRGFLHSKFNITAIDMESAAVALVCHQQGTPFIVVRGLSGNGSSTPTETRIFSPLASQNAVSVVLRFIRLLFTESVSI